MAPAGVAVVASAAGAKEGVALGGTAFDMRDDDAPGPLTPASAPTAAPAKSRISWGGMAPGRPGRDGVLRSFPQALPSLCPFGQQVYPQVMHLHVGLEGTSRPNILCSGLDKPKSASYSQGRYIEALGHKWRACSGASSIPKTRRLTTPHTSLLTSQQTRDSKASSPGMN